MAANLKGKQTNSFILKLTSSYNRRIPRDSLTGSAASSCRSTPPSHPLARTWFQVVSLLSLSRLLDADFRSELSFQTICCTYPASAAAIVTALLQDLFMAHGNTDENHRWKGIVRNLVYWHLYFAFPSNSFSIHSHLHGGLRS